MSDDDLTERAGRIVSGAMFGLTTPMMVDAIVSDLADAGLLVGPEHDAAVAAKALREMHDEMSRWEGWDTRDIGHAFLSESVLDALADAADRIGRGD